MGGSSGDHEKLWHDLFTNPRHPVFQLTRTQVRIFKRFGSDPRCKICKAPFSDAPSWPVKLVGKDRSHWNPHICNSCESWVSRHPGGAEVPMSVLFADVRGSTGMAEKRGAKDFAALMERFYLVGNKVLNASNALVDRPAGDELRAFYTPVVAGHHSRQAALAGLELLSATGHNEPEGPWVPVGVGVHTGTAYIGTVRGEGAKNVDITVVGDTVNVASRLSALASAGELLISDTAYQASRLDLAVAGSKTVSVRGREAPIAILSISSQMTG